MFNVGGLIVGYAHPPGAQAISWCSPKRRYFCLDTPDADISTTLASNRLRLIMAEAAQLPLENYGAIKRWFGELSSLPSWQQTTQIVQKYTLGNRPAA